MAVDPIESEGFAFQVERSHAGLILAAKPASDCEPSLGGKLLYAGELDAEARTLLVAANIAGAASLATSADASAGKQFVRDGVVDFLVTSLSEALRILKNEIRKRETVAVCVALAPEAVEAEMFERGVAPDLEQPVELAPQEDQTLLAWRVASAPAIWLPRLNAIALDCLSPDSSLAARRWLRLAPRYMGRLAQGIHVLRCGERSAAKFLERAREEVMRGEIGVRVELKRIHKGQPECYSFAPPGT